PAGSSPRVRQAGAEIELGPSPKLGTTRVLEAAWVAKSLGTRPELLSTLAIPDRILVRRSGFPVSRGAIVSALQRFYDQAGQNVNLENVELRWDAGMATLEAGPKLEVIRALWDAARRSWQWWVRPAGDAQGPDFLVQCADPEQSLVAARQTLMRSNHPGENKTAPALMEVGTKAWLIAESGGIRMQTEVICLERGGLGQQIRVRSATGHQVFQAEIIADKLLHARFAL